MFLTTPPDEILRYRRATVYRETSQFLVLAGVIIILAHGFDVLWAGGPNWPALLIRVTWAAGLVAESVLLRRGSLRSLVVGAAGIDLLSAVLNFLLVRVTGGAASPLIGVSYVLVLLMPLVAFEQIGFALAGAALLLAGLGIIFVVDHAPLDAVLGLVQTGGGTFIAGWVLGSAFQRARHSEETRHMALAEAFRTNEALVVQLREAATNVRTLRGLLPVCAWCRRVRSDTGYWQQIEAYVAANSDAEITHSLCPECAAREFGALGVAPEDVPQA